MLGYVCVLEIKQKAFECLKFDRPTIQCSGKVNVMARRNSAKSKCVTRITVWLGGCDRRKIIIILTNIFPSSFSSIDVSLIIEFYTSNNLQFLISQILRFRAIHKIFQGFLWYFFFTIASQCECTSFIYWI